LLPVPQHVTSPLVVQAQDASQVYVPVPGVLRELHAEEGQLVAEGDVLARLSNEALATEVARLRGEWESQKTRLENLQARRGIDPESQAQIPTAEKMLADLQQRWEKTQREFAKLVLVAPSQGQVLPPPEVEAKEDRESGTLSNWSGTPLDPRNLGCTLETGALFCLIGDASTVEAVLYIDQSDVEFVREGQSVRLKFDALPGKVLDGEVVELARRDTKVAPRELAQQVLPVEVDADGVAHPIDATYQARVRLHDNGEPLPLSSRGQAKIQVASQPLAKRLLRYLNETFTFQL
jgi:putative peptide zinc metalloprotease protein